MLMQGTQKQWGCAQIYTSMLDMGSAPYMLEDSKQRIEKSTGLLTHKFGPPSTKGKIGKSQRSMKEI